MGAAERISAAESVDSKDAETINATPPSTSNNELKERLDDKGTYTPPEESIIEDVEKQGQSVAPAADEKGAPVAPAAAGAGGPPPMDFPDGGAAAWLTVLGGAIALFCTFGYVNTFGVYQVYYQTRLLSTHSADSIAWIGSAQLFFIFSSGLLSGSIFDRHGARIIIVPSSLLLVLSVFLTSLCHKYWHFLLAQGILGGVAMGALFTPCMGVIGQYFARKRAFAMGIVVAGSSLGGVILPIMLANLLQTTSFPWTVRYIGFLFLGLLSLTCVFVKERLPHRKGTFFLPEAFKSKVYCLLIAGNFFQMWGLFTPFFFIPTYAHKLGMSQEMTIYLVSILNAASLPGRIIPGLVADKFGRMNCLVIAPAITGILVWVWLAVDSPTGLIILTAFFGFWSGSVISLFPAVLAQITPDMRMMGTYAGMAMGITGGAALTGSPIAGALLERWGYEAAIGFSGGCMVVGVGLLIGARLGWEKRVFAIA